MFHVKHKKRNPPGGCIRWVPNEKEDVADEEERKECVKKLFPICY